MELKIIHFYPDLMSLYGSYANVAVLKRRLEALGNSVTVESVVPGQTADLSAADFINSTVFFSKSALKQISSSCCLYLISKLIPKSPLSANFLPVRAVFRQLRQATLKWRLFL